MQADKTSERRLHEGPAAWEGRALREDRSWVRQLGPEHQGELLAALARFKAASAAEGETAQWLHGHHVPSAAEFPLPTLGPLMRQVRHELEEGYGLAVLRGVPLDGLSAKDRQLLHAGLASHVGTPRQQTYFGEKVQELRDVGQAHLKERRGSKHNRALGFHNDPCDVVTFLCVQPALEGGTGLYASSVAIHNALLRSAPELVETLYEPLVHSYQQYLFVRTPWSAPLLPSARSYPMPTFTEEAGHFACKYSRFYVDEAQEYAEVTRLRPQQQAALDALEEEMAGERWCLAHDYARGDAVFLNNFVCFHARTTFKDHPEDPEQRRHMLRIWLSVPNSRALAPSWAEQVFFRETRAGAPRGGVPGPDDAHERAAWRPPSTEVGRS